MTWEWDVKRLVTSVVLAGRHIQLKQSGSARAARAAVRSYREHLAEYAFIETLDIWYDRIDVKRLIDSVPDEEERARIEKKLEKARGRAVAEHDFPKLAEHVGSTPRIKDNPPLIFHSTQIYKEEAGTAEPGSRRPVPGFYGAGASGTLGRSRKRRPERAVE